MRRRESGTKRHARPRVALAPMLPEPVADPKDIPADYHLTPLPEGWRVLLLLDDRIRVRSRSGCDLTDWIPEVTAALTPSGRPRSSKGPAAVDALLCWPRRIDGAWPTLAAVDSMVLLDVLVHKGYDVTGRDLPGRLAALRSLGLERGTSISLAPTWRGGAADAWAQVQASSVAPQAGILARRAAAAYEPGQRSRDWLLLAVEPEHELLVCGVAESGAIVLGAPTPHGLAFAGVTWPTRRWPELAARCEEGPRPFPDPGIWPSLGPIVWSRPTLWVSVVPDRRPTSGRGGPTWRLQHVQEDLSPPDARAATMFDALDHPP